MEWLDDNKTFRYFASSPPGRFDTTLEDSLLGRLATWTFRYLPGRFATGRLTNINCRPF